MHPDNHLSSLVSFRQLSKYFQDKCSKWACCHTTQAQICRKAHELKQIFLSVFPSQIRKYHSLGLMRRATGWLGSSPASVSDLRASMTEELSWARHSFEHLTCINSSTLHKPMPPAGLLSHFKDEQTEAQRGYHAQGHTARSGRAGTGHRQCIFFLAASFMRSWCHQMFLCAGFSDPTNQHPLFSPGKRWLMELPFLI